MRTTTPSRDPVRTDTTCAFRNADEVRLDHRKHVFGSHLIYYSPSPTGITVVRILHQQMDVLSRLS